MKFLIPITSTFLARAQGDQGNILWTEVAWHLSRHPLGKVDTVRGIPQDGTQLWKRKAEEFMATHLHAMRQRWDRTHEEGPEAVQCDHDQDASRQQVETLRLLPLWVSRSGGRLLRRRCIHGLIFCVFCVCLFLMICLFICDFPMFNIAILFPPCSYTCFFPIGCGFSHMMTFPLLIFLQVPWISNVVVVQFRFPFYLFNISDSMYIWL